MSIADYVAGHPEEFEGVEVSNLRDRALSDHEKIQKLRSLYLFMRQSMDLPNDIEQAIDKLLEQTQ